MASCVHDEDMINNNVLPNWLCRRLLLLSWPVRSLGRVVSCCAKRTLANTIVNYFREERKETCSNSDRIQINKGKVNCILAPDNTEIHVLIMTTYIQSAIHFVYVPNDPKSNCLLSLCLRTWFTCCSSHPNYKVSLFWVWLNIYELNLRMICVVLSWLLLIGLHSILAQLSSAQEQLHLQI